VLSITDDLNYDICGDCGLCIKHIQHGNARRDFEVGQAVYYDQSLEDPFVEPIAIMSERMARRASVMVRYLMPKSEVLEIGPGGGQVAEWFQGKSYRYLGCEISAPLARRLADKEVPVINGDFEGVEFKNNYDLILSFHIIEHVINPYAQLKKAYSVTKPGGRCIVATPNAKSWEQIIFPRNSANFDPGHLYVFSPSSLKLIAEAAGWKMVSCITSEYTSDWLRIISKMVRRIRGEDETASAGKYSRSASTGIFSRIISVIAILTSPFRGMQARLKGGNEIIMVLQKPCTH
jgi:SAM-dependent methyltransferase